jgi:hypothetical protein
MIIDKRYFLLFMISIQFYAHGGHFTALKQPIKEAKWGTVNFIPYWIVQSDQEQKKIRRLSLYAADHIGTMKASFNSKKDKSWKKKLEKIFNPEIKNGLLFTIPSSLCMCLGILALKSGYALMTKEQFSIKDSLSGAGRLVGSGISLIAVPYLWKGLISCYRGFFYNDFLNQIYNDCTTVNSYIIQADNEIVRLDNESKQKRNESQSDEKEIETKTLGREQTTDEDKK